MLHGFYISKVSNGSPTIKFEAFIRNFKTPVSLLQDASFSLQYFIPVLTHSKACTVILDFIHAIKSVLSSSLDHR